MLKPTDDGRISIHTVIPLAQISIAVEISKQVSIVVNPACTLASFLIPSVYQLARSTLATVMKHSPWGEKVSLGRRLCSWRTTRDGDCLASHTFCGQPQLYDQP
jgi:hypothetical protein